MKIRKVTDSGRFFAATESDLDKSFGGVHEIGCVNWPADYPARPEVKFAIAHTGKEILLRYFVSEDYTLARVADDNGPVWTDSCVEFFISFDDTGYYNFECNSIGKALLKFRKRMDDFTSADLSVLATIIRNSSLGTTPFDEKRDQRWTLDAVIPVQALFRHTIEDLSGVAARGNFYKCGDNLTVPHFLSWRPIDHPKPNFHLEQFFEELYFES